MKLFKQFLQEEAPSDGPMLGGLTAPVEPEAAPTPAPQGIENFDGPDWMKSLSEDLIEDKSLRNFKDINDLAKSYVHARKTIGGNKVSVPDEHATPDDWNDFYKKMGLPEREKYQVKFGEAKYSDDFKNGFLDQAHEAGMLPHQAEKVFEFFNNQVLSANEQAQQMSEKELSEQADGLRKEWGSGYDKKLKTAQVAFSTFADEETTNYLNETGLANDPSLIKLFAKIGEKLNEDTFDTNTVKHLGMTKEEAEEKRTQMMGDNDHPYWNDNHPNHKKAVEDMLRYNKISES